jgi:NDP-sugar pyrophosphorylase family protein
MKENLSLVILAGGASTRMKKQLHSSVLISKDENSQANNRSKALISIDKNNRPILDYLLYNAKKAGYTTIYIITGEDNFLFKSFYGNENQGNVFNGLSINYAIQYIQKDRDKPFGTADALYQAMTQYPILKTVSFTVCNSDNLYSIDAFEFLRNTDSYPNALISYDRDYLQFSMDRISRFALLSIDENNYLKSIIEKPELDVFSSFKDSQGKLRVSMNIFRFNGEFLFSYLENCPINKTRNEKELPTALLNMINDSPNSTITIPLAEHVPDLTSKEDINILKQYVKNIDISSF